MVGRLSDHCMIWSVKIQIHVCMDMHIHYIVLLYTLHNGMVNKLNTIQHGEIEDMDHSLLSTTRPSHHFLETKPSSAAAPRALSWLYS